MIGTPLDQFAGISTFFILPLLLICPTRAQVVLAMLLAAIWFAWHIERRATS